MSLSVAQLVEKFSNPFSPVLDRGRCYRLGGTDGHEEFLHPWASREHAGLAGLWDGLR